MGGSIDLHAIGNARHVRQSSVARYEDLAYLVQITDLPVSEHDRHVQDAQKRPCQRRGAGLGCSISN
jgi:hypothetical protein